jgi:hypothetical protein
MIESALVQLDYLEAPALVIRVALETRFGERPVKPPPFRYPLRYLLVAGQALAIGHPFAHLMALEATLEIVELGVRLCEGAGAYELTRLLSPSVRGTEGKDEGQQEDSKKSVFRLGWGRRTSAKV